MNRSLLDLAASVIIVLDLIFSLLPFAPVIFPYIHSQLRSTKEP